jgi:hypothetical protein
MEVVMVKGRIGVKGIVVTPVLGAVVLANAEPARVSQVIYSVCRKFFPQEE